MRFLVDASLPRSAAPMLRAAGHDALHVRDIGMRSADDPVIAAHARSNGLVLVSRDSDFGDTRNYPPADYAGIVVVRPHGHATAVQVVKLLEAFTRREDWLAQLPGRLAIVEPGRVRFRPA
jgi:predicted nuclease of predicted toxin-antitoxin system